MALPPQEAGGDWVRRVRRANLLDMHIPEWDPSFLSRFDTRAYADALDRAGVDAAYIYTSSCLGLAYWPTPAGHRHAGLGGRDLVRELTEELHARGKTVVLYYNFWSKWASDQHPDWRVVRSDGRGADDPSLAQGRYGVCCLNSPYRDFVHASVRDLCERYSFEGFWIDMIFWPLAVCYCAHCRRRWLDESGREIPRIVSWDDHAWVSFQRARERWLAGAVVDIAALVRAVKPGVSFGTNHSIWSYGWQCGMSGDFYAASDYLTGDFEGLPVDESMVCKFFQSLTARPLFEFMTPRCLDLREHTTSKPKEVLEAQAFSTIANNGRFLFIDAVDPVGTVNTDAYAMMGDIYTAVRSYEPFLHADAVPSRDIGIYVNVPSFIDPADNGRDIGEVPVAHAPLVKRLRTLCRTLIDAHLPFGMLTRANLDGLDGCQALVLPDLPMLDPQEVAALEGFVARGGSVLVTGRTSLRTSDGQRQADFLLGPLLGIAREGETVENVTYLSPGPGAAELFAPFTRQYPMSLDAPQVLARTLPGTEVLATLTLPHLDPAHPERFSSTISNPPQMETRYPSLTMREAGAGRAAWAAGPLEMMESRHHTLILARLLRSLLRRRPWFSADAPRSVELTLFRAQAGNRYTLCVLSFQPQQPNIPVEPFEVRLSLGAAAVSGVTLVPAGRAVACRQSDGITAFRTERLETFQMYVIDCR